MNESMQRIVKPGVTSPRTSISVRILSAIKLSATSRTLLIIAVLWSSVVFTVIPTGIIITYKIMDLIQSIIYLFIYKITIIVYKER